MVELTDWQEERIMEICELLRDIRDRLPDPEAPPATPPETDADGHCTRCGLEVEDPRELAHECPPGFQAKTGAKQNEG